MATRGWLGAAIALVIVTVVLLLAKSAPLTAPADATATDYPARPEWHTLFLFQFLKLFHGATAEMVGSIVIPGVVGLILLLLPIIAKILPAHVARTFVVGFAATLALGIGGFTAAAILADLPPAREVIEEIRAKKAAGTSLTEYEENALRSAQFQDQKARALLNAERAVELAEKNGIPPLGALELLRSDPLTRGPELFASNCASCHRYNGHDGLGSSPTEPATSSDLGGFGSASWIRGLLRDPAGDHYFGLMKKEDGEPAHTKMAEWVQSFKAKNAADPAAGEAKLDAVAAYLADEAVHPGRLAEITRYTDLSSDTATSQERTLREGRFFFMKECNECHMYQGSYEGTTRAPEMFGYGSTDWTILMIAEPDHNSRYRSGGKEPAQMPRFVEKLSADEIRMIATWLYESRDDSTQ